MIDQIFVCIGSIIDRYSTQSSEKVSGLDTDKPVNTDITDIRCVAIYLIADVAMLFDILAAGTAIKFLTDFNTNERPFSSRGIEVGCH